jgi:hypothetical protein
MFLAGLDVKQYQKEDLVFILTYLCFVAVGVVTLLIAGEANVIFFVLLFLIVGLVIWSSLKPK